MENETGVIILLTCNRKRSFRKTGVVLKRTVLFGFFWFFIFFGFFSVFFVFKVGAPSASFFLLHCFFSPSSFFSSSIVVPLPLPPLPLPLPLPLTHVVIPPILLPLQLSP